MSVFINPKHCNITAHCLRERSQHFMSVIKELLLVREFINELVPKVCPVDPKGSTTSSGGIHDTIL